MLPLMACILLVQQKEDVVPEVASLYSSSIASALSWTLAIDPALAVLSSCRRLEA